MQLRRQEEQELLLMVRPCLMAALGLLRHRMRSTVGMVWGMTRGGLVCRGLILNSRGSSSSNHISSNISNNSSMDIKGRRMCIVNNRWSRIVGSDVSYILLRAGFC